MKILIAEDEDVSRKTLAKGLQKQGFEVVETTDGEQAWQKMQEPDAPELLVLDIMMPVMDGLELCKKIRAYYTWPQPYIIMLTAMTGEDDVVHGLEEAGADDYISKPYNFNELKSRILVGQRMLEMQSGLLGEITNREKTEERLRQVNKEYERVFNGTQDAMFLVSVEGAGNFRFMRNNEAHQAASGISLEAIRDKTPEQLLGEELGRKVTRNYISCVKAGKPISYEEDLDLPGGKRTWFTTLTPVFENSEIQYIVVSSQDISERKQAEERLRDSERRIQTITNSAQEAIIMINPQGNISYWNPMAESIFGYSAAEVKDQNLHFLLAPQRYHEAYTNAFPYFQETGNGNYVGKKIELAAVCKDGREIPISLSLSSVLLQNEWYAVGIVRDITERKQMERSLRASEKRLRDITETMGEGLYVMDNQGLITFLNPAATELLGYSAEELLGRVGHDLFHVHNQQAERTPLQQCPIFQAVNQGKTYHGEDFFQRRDKSIFPVDVIGQPMWEDGQVVGSVTAFRDVTQRKSIEESLRESEERFRTTLENLPGAIFAHDLEGYFLLVNRTACQQTGYSQEELLQMQVKDIDLQAMTRGDILSLWQNLKPGQSSMIESHHTRKDGSQYPVEVFLNSITMDRQPVLLAVAFDISQRKEVEERLRYLATTDELTGMWNRRRFTQAIRNELKRAHRYQQIFSLLMLDIDHFKKINDTYGHAAGDEVLRHFARLIWQSMRQVDMPGRFGGEEFAIILPHTDLDGAYMTAERLRKYIEKTPAVYNKIEIPFSVSIGVVTYQDDIKNEDELFKMVDDALYEAKNKGRNLTVAIPRR